MVYSATHFLASHHIAADQVTPSSGLALFTGTLHLFAHPLEVSDAFLCLLAVGIVLAIIRSITGNIAACIGLHAGWVWVMLVTHELAQPVRDRPLSFLLSRFDGFVGWLVLGWTMILGMVCRCSTRDALPDGERGERRGHDGELRRPTNPRAIGRSGRRTRRQSRQSLSGSSSSRHCCFSARLSGRISASRQPIQGRRRSAPAPA